jgi:AcrR family transcriptional regulator
VARVSETAVDHRQAVAARNVEAILDAAERLLAARENASITAVASEAGLSRVTVYAHFPNRTALLQAVVKRTVERAAAVLEEAESGSGSPLEALDRLIEAAWRVLDRHSAIAQATSDQLPPGAITETHAAAFRPVTALVARGRREGVFRTDVPARWLVTSFFALMHACGDEVRAGRLKAADAPRILQATLRDLAQAT